MRGPATLAVQTPTLVGRDDAIAVLDGLLADARRGRSGALVLQRRGRHREDGAARRRVGARARRDGPPGARPGVGARAAVRDARRAPATGGRAAAGDPARAGARAARRARARAAGRVEPPRGRRGDAQHAGRRGRGAARASRSSTTSTGAIPSPREALAFAARRLDAEGVVLLLAARPDEGSFDADGLPELRVEGIGLAAARALLLDRLGSCPPGPALQRLVDETDGNPLALLELAHARPRRRRRGELPPPCRQPLRRSAARAPDRGGERHRGPADDPRRGADGRRARRRVRRGRGVRSAPASAAASCRSAIRSSGPPSTRRRRRRTGATSTWRSRVPPRRTRRSGARGIWPRPRRARTPPSRRSSSMRPRPRSTAAARRWRRGCWSVPLASRPRRTTARDGSWPRRGPRGARSGRTGRWRCSTRRPR